MAIKKHTYISYYTTSLLCFAKQLFILFVNLRFTKIKKLVIQTCKTIETHLINLTGQLQLETFNIFH